MGQGKVRVSPDKTYLEVQVGVYYEDFTPAEALKFANALLSGVGEVMDARQEPRR
jgi:hypothetical protein